MGSCEVVGFRVFWHAFFCPEKKKNHGGGRGEKSIGIRAVLFSSHEMLKSCPFEVVLEKAALQKSLSPVDSGRTRFMPKRAKDDGGLSYRYHGHIFSGGK